MSKRYLFIKRIFDIIASFLGCLLCLALIWWWVSLIDLFSSKGNPFFVQNRIGKNKRTFRILKFRSLKNDAPKYIAPFKITGEQQYNMETRFGHFLRKTQLDETLQLFNILIGQMSFIGPRPGAAINEVELIKEREKLSPLIYTLRPGLTGLAQVDLIEDRHNPALKAQKDFEYYQNMSLKLDIKIIFRTIAFLFRKKR